MADMSSKKRRQREPLTQAEIDEQVIAEAGREEAWEAPIRVRPTAPTAFHLPSDLAARAAFLSRIHHRRGLEDWLMHVIRERVEIEETAYADAKRELSAKTGA
jgi:hypothetical protein